MARDEPVPQALVEERWAAWLVARNRRGALVGLLLTIVIYPLFGVLDWLVVPQQWWTLMFITRGAVVAWCIFHLATLKTSWFEKHWRLYTSTNALVLALGIVVMVIALDGFLTGYYAGILLVMIGVGILFVWRLKQAMITYSTIILSYTLPCLILAEGSDWSLGIPNMFFMVSVATTVTAGHAVTYRSLREQLVNQIMLERTKSTLERAHEQLKQLDRFKSQFFANITHELKTPLAMILSPLELMLSGDMGRFGEQQVASLQSMFRNGMKLLRLIQDLLDLSRLEESRIRLRIVENDLVVYLRGLIAQTQALTQRKQIEMIFETSVERCLVWYDPDRIERVFVNLLSNAAKYTPEGGHIRVSLRDEGSAVHVMVQDDGPGFPPDKAEQLFERFFQLDMGGTRRFGGAGIGLALARELVELHGGKIWAESAAGQGACFHVVLLEGREHFRPEVLDRRAERRDVPGGKRAEDQGITDWSVALAAREDFRFLDIAEATERRIVERDQGDAERPYTVLVVEDTPDIIRLVHLSLRQHFRVMAAEDGLKGLELAFRQLPSLVITDLMMPGIDGNELTRRLRQDPRTRHIPVIMLTARGDLEDRVAGMESGVNVYLTKPFSPRELLSTVRALLNLQETQADILLEQKMDSLEHVASGLAHEINNPLNYVKNAVERIRKDSAEILELVQSTAGRTVTASEGDRLRKLQGRVQGMFDTSEAGLQRIAGVVELMRKYSREGYSRRLVACDVFLAARDVVDVVVPAIGREVRVEADLGGQALVECVPEEFNQVLSNLLQNAIEAAPEGTGLVRLVGRVEAGQAVLSVSDNGPGIPPEIRQHIFTPFFTTKGPGQGMGLGLTISWRVVKSIGGTIDVRSAPGEGTEFVVRVPLVPPERQVRA